MTPENRASLYHDFRLSAEANFSDKYRELDYRFDGIQRCRGDPINGLLTGAVTRSRSVGQQISRAEKFN
jgi:hypothetical protein